jgi:cell division septum initiation protein DivIVA
MSPLARVRIISPDLKCGKWVMADAEAKRARSSDCARLLRLVLSPAESAGEEENQHDEQDESEAAAADHRAAEEKAAAAEQEHQDD